MSNSLAFKLRLSAEKIGSSSSSSTLACTAAELTEAETRFRALLTTADDRDFNNL